jgi:8-oxo-dGTP diphosphatase
MQYRLPRKKFYELFKLVPRLAADGVAVNSKGEVLLIRRNHSPYKGMWAIPGGFVELGETTENAATREVFEESGIKTRTVRLVGVYSNPRRDPRGQVVSVAYLLKPVGGRLSKSDETSDARYFPAGKTPKLPTDQGSILRDAMKLRKMLHKK